MQYNTGVYYVDRNGRVIVDVNRFASVGNFVNGLAPASSNFVGSGFVDKSGSIVIGQEFAEAKKFSEDFAAVKIRDWGYIDLTGGVVIKDEFDAAYGFSEGLALTRKGGRLFFIDRHGQKIVELDTADVALEYSGDQKFSGGLIVARDMKTDLCGFLDKTGKFAIEPRFNDASNFSEGLARVSIIEDHREYLGFIDRSGKYAIPPTFDIDSDFLRSATDFSEGLASVIGGPPTTEDIGPKFVYIDKTGEIVLRTDYSHASPFHEGLAAVYSADKNKWGFIDKSGNLKIPLEFDGVGEFSDGLAWVMKVTFRK